LHFLGGYATIFPMSDVAETSLGQVATTATAFDLAGFRAERLFFSKTECRGFKSFCPCNIGENEKG